MLLVTFCKDSTSLHEYYDSNTAVKSPQAIFILVTQKIWEYYNFNLELCNISSIVWIHLCLSILINPETHHLKNKRLKNGLTKDYQHSKSNGSRQQRPIGNG